MTKVLNYKFKSFLLSTSYLLFTRPAFAAVDLTNAPGINLTIQGVLGILTGLACWISRVALVVMVIAIVYYGMRFMMAQGDPGKLNEAKTSFIWGLVGVLVVLGTYTIIATVANSLGADYTLLVPLNCTNP